MDRAVVGFARVLRDHGLRVSPAETLDALRALAVLGVGDRRAVRDALRTTLVKYGEDADTFERLFDAYFSLAPAAIAAADRHGHAEALPRELELELDSGGDDAAPGRSDDHAASLPGLRRYVDQRRLRQSPGGHADSDRLRVSLFAQQLMLNRRDEALDRALRQLTQQLRVRRMRNLGTPGPPALGAPGAELPVDVAAGLVAELLDDLRDLDVDPALLAELEAQAAAVRATLPEVLAALLARRGALATPTTPDLSGALIGVRAVSEAERRAMGDAVRRLAARLHGSRSRRRRPQRRGTLDIAHTLRRNLRYDGAPFEPAWRGRRDRRPRLVVLCDVSLSTRNLARFWLQLVSQLTDLFASVRTYAFVADVVEVTELFRQRPFEAAAAELFGGAALDTDRNSDFGRAVGRFRDEHLGAVTGRTSVVVLGDGRNNGHDPNLDALREVARRARRLVWMTPEQRGGWRLGGCDLPRYETICDRIEVVRSVDELAAVAEQLVASPNETSNRR